MVQATFWMTVGERIAYHRKRAGFTQEGMAELLHLSRATIVNMEMGVTGIRLDRAKAIADACNVTINDLVAGT